LSPTISRKINQLEIKSSPSVKRKNKTREHENDKKVKIEPTSSCNSYNDHAKFLHTQLKEFHRKQVNSPQLASWLEISYKFRRGFIETSTDSLENQFLEFDYLSNSTNVS
jgi:hypothetical protein